MNDQTNQGTKCFMNKNLPNIFHFTVCRVQVRIKTEGNDMKSHSVRPTMTQRTGEGKKKGRNGHESQRKKKKILERGRK